MRSTTGLSISVSGSVGLSPDRTFRAEECDERMATLLALFGTFSEGLEPQIALRWPMSSERKSLDCKALWLQASPGSRLSDRAASDKMRIRRLRASATLAARRLENGCGLKKQAVAISIFLRVPRGIQTIALAPSSDRSEGRTVPRRERKKWPCSLRILVLPSSLHPLQRVICVDGLMVLSRCKMLNKTKPKL